MAHTVTLDDVYHIASLARLGLTPQKAQALVRDMNGILAHMEVLAKVDRAGSDETADAGASGAPLRSDSGPPIPLARSIDAFAPQVRDGFILVPRLSTHESPEET